MRSYIVKKNHIGLMVSDIFWYRQTYTLLLAYKDYTQTSCYFSIRIVPVKLEQLRLTSPRLHSPRFLHLSLTFKDINSEFNNYKCLSKDIYLVICSLRSHKQLKLSKVSAPPRNKITHLNPTPIFKKSIWLWKYFNKDVFSISSKAV